jgi:ABC-type Fe3+-hydroxamate transport system substrate-binding protein
VFIALFVFSIAALAIAAMTFMSIQGNAKTNQMSQATFLAQNVMEELLVSDDTGDTVLIPLNVDHIVSNLNSEGTTTPAGPYRLNWKVIEETSATSRKLQVEVSWFDPMKRGENSVVIKSLWSSSLRGA